MAAAKDGLRVCSPLTGQAVPLEQVPDEVFSQKVLGDGLAIIPVDGNIYSPVDGEVSSVAETKHAYGFTSGDGLEVLVHYGLETVSLKGEGFTPRVREGDRVKLGDLVAEVDVELLKSKGLNLITPVLVCDGADGLMMETASGSVKQGETVITLRAEEAAPAPAERPEPVDTGKRLGVNFDFL